VRFIVLFYGVFFPIVVHATRSIHRINTEELPTITVSSTQNPTPYKLMDTNLRPVPLLHIFDKKHFMENLLPKTPIEIDTQKIDTIVINTLANELLNEIDQKHKTYKNFTILKQSGFVRYKKSGLLIVKFKDYPLVLKLFIEPPESFVNPYDKGFEATNFFIAGGAMRHTLGFTRLKTRMYVQQKILESPIWRDKIIMPRKWFWLPASPVWLTIKTHNIGKKAEDAIQLPAIYGVIAEELHRDPTKKTDYNELMSLSRFLEHRIDPHTKNFFIEKNTGKIALIDTELFPIILGFDAPIKPQSTHIKWYLYLAGKYVKEKLFTPKNKRQERKTNITHYYVDTRNPTAPAIAQPAQQ